MITKIIHKILCWLDNHTPKETLETEKGSRPFTIRHYSRCKYCNKRIQYHYAGNSWYEVEDKWLEG